MPTVHEETLDLIWGGKQPVEPPNFLKLGAQAKQFAAVRAEWRDQVHGERLLRQRLAAPEVARD
jgi:hypothetical protein